MSEQQMKELASTREITDKVFIMAPVTGFIIARKRVSRPAIREGYRVVPYRRLEPRLGPCRPLPERGGVCQGPGMKVRVTIPETKKNP